MSAHSLALNSKDTEERKSFFGWNPQSSKWSQQTMLLRWTNAMTWYEIASIECSLQIQWQVALKTMTFIYFELKMQVNRAENLVLCIWNTSENIFSRVSCCSLRRCSSEIEILILWLWLFLLLPYFVQKIPRIVNRTL